MSDHDIVTRHGDAATPPSLVSVPGVGPSEEGPTLGTVAEKMASGFEYADSAMDFVAQHDHLQSGVKTFAGIDSGLLSMVAAGGDAYEGVHHLQEGKTAEGAGELAQAGGSAVGGVANSYRAAAEGFAKYG